MVSQNESSPRTTEDSTDCYFPNSNRLEFLFTIRYNAISELHTRLVKCYFDYY